MSKLEHGIAEKTFPYKDCEIGDGRDVDEEFVALVDQFEQDLHFEVVLDTADVVHVRIFNAVQRIKSLGELEVAFESEQLFDYGPESYEKSRIFSD